MRKRFPDGGSAPAHLRRDNSASTKYRLLLRLVSIDQKLDARDGRYVTAYNDHRTRRELADHSAHLPHLAYVDDDRRDPHDVILVSGELQLEILPAGEIEHGAGRRDILLDHHDAPRTVKHSR